MVRDRLTWTVYLQIAIYGYFLYAFTPSVNLLRDDEQISRAVSGLHGTGLAVGAITAGLIAPRLSARIGRMRSIWLSLLVLCVGIGIFVSGHVVGVTIAGAIVAGLGGTVVVNLTAAVLTAHHGANGGAAVTQANGFGSGVGIFAPLLISAAIAIGLGWRAGILVAVVLAIGVAAVFLRRDDGPAQTLDRDAPQLAGTRLGMLFWWSWSVLVMTTAIEFSMTIWTSDVLQNHDGLSKGTAATGVTAIVAGMTLGRLASTRFTTRYSIDALLVSVFGVTVVGFATFWATSLPALGFVGLFITGIGISLQFPLAITRLIGFSHGRADLATGYGSIGTGLSVGLAPFGLGAFADHVGSHTAMLVVPLFALLGVAGIAVSHRPEQLVAPVPAPVAAIGDVPGVVE
ncbi:MAG TPA: MFS transporter [Acidothermaceae bacterium]